MLSLNMRGLNLQMIKKGTKFLNTSIEILNDSNREPNKFWLHQGRKLYDKLM